MRTLTLPILVAALLVPASLLAQPADPPAGGGEPPPGPADKVAEPRPATGPAPTDPGSAPVPAAPGAAADPADKATTPEVGAGTDMSAYGVAEGGVPPGGTLEWARRRMIRVIQKRAVLKEGRHGVSLYGGVVPNDDFFAYVAGGLGYSYFFSEDLALDLAGAYTLEAKTALEGSLTASRSGGKGPGLTVRLPETLMSYAAARACWYLLHGKLGFFETRLTEFDAGLNFGLGANLTKVTSKSGEVKYRVKPNGNVGVAMLFYLGERWALRLDYTQFFYPKDGGGVSFPIATTLGLSWFTEPLQ